MLAVPIAQDLVDRQDIAFIDNQVDRSGMDGFFKEFGVSRIKKFEWRSDKWKTAPQWSYTAVKKNLPLGWKIGFDY
jgi:hypothetical protein